MSVLGTLLLTLLVPLAPEPAKAAPERGLRRISNALAYDLENKFVVIEAEVVFREGPLELLLCPRRTKEHESILSADVRPRDCQFAMLLIGAVPGRPAAFEPFRPPVGQKLKIWLEVEEAGRRRLIDARAWIRDTKTNQPMAADFVFAGSRFHKVPGVERPIWLGDEGDLICVANFPGFVIDVGAASSKENAERMFEAWTERIPPHGTKVRVIIEPLSAD